MFISGELIRSYLIAAAGKKCDKNKLNTINLSMKLTAARVQDTKNKTNSQFKTRQMISSGSWLLNELADGTNTAQLLFIEGVTARLERA